MLHDGEEVGEEISNCSETGMGIEDGYAQACPLIFRTLFVPEFIIAIVFFFKYFRWLRWTLPDIVRDDVDEADPPVCGRRIIDVKLVAERLGLGCYGCGEKLHLGYNILLEK